MKNIKIYDEVSSLLLSMSNDELLVLKKYIVAFDKTKKDIESKYIMLINHICYKQEDKLKTIFFKLYPNKNQRAFNMLCYRLRDKALESLILDVNVSRKGQVSAYGKAYIKVHKMLMQLRMCFTKGQGILSLTLMNKIQNIGKKFAFYDEIIQVLYLKQRLLNVKHGSEKHKKLKTEIKHFEYLRDSLHLANQYLNRLQTETAFKKSLSKKIKFFQEAIKDLNKRYEKTDSKELYYQKEWLKVLYFQESKDYEKSTEIGNQLLSFIKQETFVYKPLREGSLLLNLAYNNIFTGKLNTSVIQSEKALDYFPKYTYNYYLLQGVRFYAFIYSGMQKEAFRLAKEICKYNNPDSTKFQEDRWRYWLAVCYFNKGNFDLAQEELNKVQELKRDEQGWNLSIRILNIACSIELDNQTIASNQINALQKFYQRKPNIQARLKAILSILLSLEYSFQFKDVYKKHSSDFEKIIGKKGWYTWKVKTPELLIFDQWFIAKMNNEKYNPDYKELLLH